MNMSSTYSVCHQKSNTCIAARYLKLSFSSILLLVASSFFSIAIAANASLSTDTINIAAGATGSITISGDDDGCGRNCEFQFRWDIPSADITITKGTSNNLRRFEVNLGKNRLRVETNGAGAFSATFNFTSNIAGSYTFPNTRAEINLNPADFTVDVGGSSGGGAPPPPSGSGGGSATSDYNLFIETGSVSLTASPETGNGAISIPIWSYTNVDGSASTLPGTVLESVEGGSITVSVTNNHDRDHNFVVQGLTNDTTAIAPGQTRTYTINTPDAGVYLYNDTLANNVNRSLGLFGAVVVRTSDGSQRAWSGGPSYDQEKLWVINDLDKPRWTDVAINGGNVDTSKYKPNYFLMNGMNGFQSMEDPVTNVEGNVGDVFIIRIVNAGQFDQSLHFHSNHFTTISRDSSRLNTFELQDTINVKAGTTAMVIYTLNQPGHYPMHVHTAQMETGNGVYLNGTVALIIAY